MTSKLLLESSMLFLHVVMFCFFAVCAQATEFQHTILKDTCYDTTTEITCYHQHKAVGFLQVTCVPFSIAVIHSFFVYPEYRNQGYGTKLLQYTSTYLRT